MEEKKAKLIFNMGVASSLLRKNAKVIDVKPDRDNHDKTIVAFERDEAFEKAFAELNEELHAKEAAESK